MTIERTRIEITYLVIFEAHWMVVQVLVPDGVPEVPLLLVLVVELVELVPADGAGAVGGRPRGHGRRLDGRLRRRLALLGAGRFKPVFLCERKKNIN